MFWPFIVFQMTVANKSLSFLSVIYTVKKVTIDFSWHHHLFYNWIYPWLDKYHSNYTCILGRLLTQMLIFLTAGSNFIPVYDIQWVSELWQTESQKVSRYTMSNNIQGAYRTLSEPKQQFTVAVKIVRRCMKFVKIEPGRVVFQTNDKSLSLLADAWSRLGHLHWTPLKQSEVCWLTCLFIHIASS